jgi:hypothetical protein
MMLGYMTAKEAVANGFTNHGKYYGIPVWIADDEEGLMVAAKWAPMEYVMTAAHYVEGFMRSVLFPDDEPAFQFLVGQPIEGDKN